MLTLSETKGLTLSETKGLTLSEAEGLTPLQAAPLPCLDSGNDCLRTLTEAAIERSPELQILDERIALIDRRLQLAGQRIDQANARQWTGYLTTDPIAILQNLFGGGQVQQQRIAITDLEIRAADLEAAKAELERQRAAKRSQLGEQVLTLVIGYETAGDRERAILAQLSNHDLLTRITEIDYRLGGSSTETYLTRIAQREQLEIQLNRYRLERGLFSTLCDNFCLWNREMLTGQDF
ncbi:hypothetical protein [Microcystis aeruginosa]|nr:hypothetical protein [Microcystis aeruginosa]